MSTPKEILNAAQQLIDNNLIEAAQTLLKQNNLGHIKVEDGKLVDPSDMTTHHLGKFITVNKQMLDLKLDVEKLAPKEHPVLIIGPTGTGKEIIAQALHGKREGPFRSVNCAGLPETLIESELFGYKQGAFTGALKDRDGLMKSAENGSIFLDEVSELPMQAQGKLLRAIQNKRIRKVGGTVEEGINCRFICASNKSLVDLCNAGLFRIDLYARISTFELHTLSLLERRDDIIPLYKALGANDVLILHVENLLSTEGNQHLWPFNVRSIQQHIARYAVLGRLP